MVKSKVEKLEVAIVEEKKERINQVKLLRTERTAKELAELKNENENN